MKLIWVFIINLALLQCTPSYKKIDIEEAGRPVPLDSSDLAAFWELRAQLISDSAAIRKQNDETTAPANRNSWTTTNAYYLNQIDSVRYAWLLSRLRGKFTDAIWLNGKGSVIFTIKENIQMHSGNYNETFSHQLISADCHCPVSSVFNHIDTVYFDSAVSGNWRYVYYKALTGW